MDKEETLAEREERFLGEAVGILTETEELDPLQRQQKLGMDEVRRIEEVVTTLAREYRDENALSRQSSRRIGDAVKQLADIEAACAAVAAAFDRAGQDAYNVLNGLGPAGSIFHTMAWGLPGSGENYAEGRRHSGALSTITGHYHLPYGPQEPTAEMLGDILARGAVSGDPVYWPVAIAALGMMVGTRREDHELRFEQERRRLAAVRNHGPQGSLPTSEKNIVEAETKLRDKKSPNNNAINKGGNQNISNTMRGNPKWILARECFDIVLSLGYKLPNEISSSREGWFFRFVIKTYGVATGIDIENSAGSGTDGLDKYVRLIVNVGPRLHHLKMRRSVGAMWAPLSEREREELGSLQQVWAEGRDFDWRE